MRILDMSRSDCRQAKQHPALRGKKKIGAGAFTAVYEGPDQDTVYKLTVDPSGYWVFNDGIVRVEGKHFPASFHSFCNVGKVTIHANLSSGRPRLVPLFLYEQERLEPLPIKSEQRKLAKAIIQKARAISSDSSLFTSLGYRGRVSSVDDAKVTLTELSKCEEFPESIREALSDLAGFCDYYDDLFLDMHFQNFMIRPSTGDLVFSDPFGCASIFYGHKNY